MWILPAPGIEPLSLPWQADSYLFLWCTTREVSTIECYKTQYLIILCTSSWITPILPGREHWVSSRTTEQLMPQGFTEMSFYFSQILKADLDDVRFPGSSTLLQYEDDSICFLLLFSSFLTGRQKPLTKAFCIKGTQRCQRKIAVCSNPGFIFRASDTEKGLYLGLDRLYRVLSFSKLKAKCWLWALLRPVGYCWNWIPNFSFMAKPLYSLLNINHLDPV